jgi:hypothetical protein
VKRLVGREHQGQVAVEEVAQGLETPDEALPTGASGGEHGVHGRAEVLRQLADECSDENVAGQALAPQRRVRTACYLSDAFQRETVEAALSQNLDRREAELLFDDRLNRRRTRHATQALQNAPASRPCADGRYR